MYAVESPAVRWDGLQQDKKETAGGLGGTWAIPCLHHVGFQVLQAGWLLVGRAIYPAWMGTNLVNTCVVRIVTSLSSVDVLHACTEGPWRVWH